MTQIDAAVAAIEAAGWTQLAIEFRQFPQHREKIIAIVCSDARQRLGYGKGGRLEHLLRVAAS